MNSRAFFGLFDRPTLWSWGSAVVFLLVFQGLLGIFLSSPIGALFSGFVAGAVVSRRLDELRRSTVAWSLPGVRRDFAIPALLLGLLVAGLGVVAEQIGRKVWHSPFATEHGSSLALAAFILLGYSLAFWVQIGLSAQFRRWLLGCLVALFVLGPLMRIRQEWVFWVLDRPALGRLAFGMFDAIFILPRSWAIVVAVTVLAICLLAWSQRVETWRLASAPAR